MMERSDRIVLKPGIWRSALGIVVCAFFVWVLMKDLSAPESPPWKVYLFAFISVLFGGLGLLNTYWLVSGRPTVMIDSTGITAGTFRTWHVSWDEVDYVVPYRTPKTSSLAIVLKDMDAYMEQLGPIDRLVATVFRRLGSSPIRIDGGTISMSIPELADLLHARYGVRVEGRKAAT